MTAGETRVKHALFAFLMVVTTMVGVAGKVVPVGAEEVPTCGPWAATIIGTSGNDEITGTAGRDVIVGRGGDDTIYGLGGNDVICGNGGDDILLGHRGHDRLFGGPGDDILRGFRGNDRAWGQAGTDTIFGGIHADVCVGEAEANCELDKRWGHGPDDWLPLLEQYFGDIGETENGRIILGCESAGEPFVLGPETQWGSAMGLFQFIPPTWEQWNPETPEWAGESPFHPEANIATARRLYDAYVDEGRWGWTPWSCKRLLDAPS